MIGRRGAGSPRNQAPAPAEGSGKKPAGRLSWTFETAFRPGLVARLPTPTRASRDRDRGHRDSGPRPTLQHRHRGVDLSQDHIVTAAIRMMRHGEVVIAALDDSIIHRIFEAQDS